MRNRTFWFGDYEGLRETLGQTTVSTVPSEAARQGRLAAGAVSVDPQIARALALYPLPNGPLLGNGDTGQYFAVPEQGVGRRLRPRSRSITSRSPPAASTPRSSSTTPRSSSPTRS